MSRSRFLVLAFALLTVALSSGCVTHIKTDITQNPPPVKKLSDFTKFEMTKVTLVPPYAGQTANERALVKIQENVNLAMTPLLSKWNADGASATPVRTLLITPVVTEIKFISGGTRVFAGGLAGSSAVVLVAKLTDKDTGEVIASPTFYARAAAMGGAFSFGTTDNMMLTRIAGRLTSYLAANYPAAVGGPSGVADAPAK
jgi:hypothetical protein